jgi:hypothetical protein
MATADATVVPNKADAATAAAAQRAVEADNTLKLAGSSGNTASTSIGATPIIGATPLFLNFCSSCC